jgi:hypothetical protein
VRHRLRKEKRENLLTREAGLGRGAESYDSKKAWASLKGLSYEIDFENVDES